jgi:transposase
MKSLPAQTVQDAIVLLRQGKSVRDVSGTLGISVFSVSKIRQRDKENIPVPQLGRPSKVTKKTKSLLARQMDTGKLLTLKDGQRFVQATQGCQVHVQSIHNYLREQQVKAYVQQKKPGLTKDQVAARYQFAKDHLSWTVEDWKNVMFSDETVISRIGSFGRKFYYKRQCNKKIMPHHIKKTKQGGGGKIMIWGCITYFGVGDACWLQGGVDAEAYVNVLKDYVLSSRDWYEMDQDKFVFQQDNAAVHTAGIVKNYVKRSNIKTMIWPANSPDLNPIENVWAFMKRKLDQYPEPPKSLEELWERAQDVWTNIDENFLRELYESMPRRMNMLYNNKGQHIKY